VIIDEEFDEYLKTRFLLCREFGQIPLGWIDEKTGQWKYTPLQFMILVRLFNWYLSEKKKAFEGRKR